MPSPPSYPKVNPADQPVLFLAVTSESQGARPRYLLTAFPLVIALARDVEGETFRWVLATSAALMMLMTVLVAHPLTLEP